MTAVKMNKLYYPDSGSTLGSMEAVNIEGYQCMINF